MNRVAVVAIDGPAGSGKSSTARAVAEALGFAHLDSGALYRAVTLAALQAGAPTTPRAVLAAVEAAGVRLVAVGGDFRPEVSGVDVSEAVRSDRVTERVSAVAALGPVREWVNRQLRAAVAGYPGGVVVDGRDIGTVVFPEAALKVYLTATPEERARRRLLQEGRPVDRDSLGRASEALRQRDQADRSRALAPLKPAPDALVLDSTGLSFGEQVERIVAEARKVFGSLDIDGRQD